MSNLLKHTFQEPTTRTVLPAGEYPYKITEVYAISQSKAGNPMIPIEIEVTGPDGSKVKIEDRLVFTESALWKIDQFIQSAYPMVKPGDSIDFSIPSKAQFFKNRTGMVKIAIEEYVHNGKEGKKNVVEAFIAGKVDGAADSPVTAPAGGEIDDNSIPF